MTPTPPAQADGTGGSLPLPVLSKGYSRLHRPWRNRQNAFASVAAGPSSRVDRAIAAAIFDIGPLQVVGHRHSAINYVYTLLYGEVWRAVVRAGLDPYFGIIHGTERDQGSLVFDLIEEYRAPFGDRVVIGLLGRGFAIELDKEGRLRTGVRHKLVNAFHKQWRRQVRWREKMRSASEILELQATSLRNAFTGNDEYRPFRFRW